MSVLPLALGCVEDTLAYIRHEYLPSGVMDQSQILLFSELIEKAFQNKLSFLGTAEFHDDADGADSTVRLHLHGDVRKMRVGKAIPTPKKKKNEQKERKKHLTRWDS